MRHRKFCSIFVIFLILLAGIFSLQAQQPYDLKTLSNISKPLSITSLRGTGSNIGVWAKIVNHSNENQTLRHYRGTGVAASGGGQVYGKVIAIGIQAQTVKPWYSQPYYDYTIPANSEIEIPLYVLCQNLYKPPLLEVQNYSDFTFYALSDSVLKVYLGTDKMNRFLMDSLTTKFWVNQKEYIFYTGTLSESDHALIKSGYWVADSNRYVDYQGKHFYAVDSLFIVPQNINWAIWAVTDHADSSVMKEKINEWRAHDGLPALQDDDLRILYCPVYAILTASGFDDLARGFSQNWYDTFLDVRESKTTMPIQFQLLQNYPNPFNGNTTFVYELPSSGKVVVNIYSLLGRKIETLVNQYQNAGTYQVVWDATNYPSGVYIYRLMYGNQLFTRKCLYLK